MTQAVVVEPPGWVVPKNRLVVACCIALGALVLQPTASAQAVPAHSAALMAKHKPVKHKPVVKPKVKPKPKVAPAPTPYAEQEPSSDEIERQHAQVAKLRADALRQAAGVDDAQLALQGAAVLAGQALEEYAQAVRELQTRQQIEQQNDQVFAQAQRTLEVSRQQLGQWARESYTSGSGLAANGALTTVLQADTAADMTINRTVLRGIGRSRSRAMTAAATARREADRAAVAAADASEQAAAAAVSAEAAKQASEQAVNAQRRLLGVAESSLAQSNQSVRAAEAREADLRAARLVTAPPTPSSGSGATKDNRVTGPVGSCTGAAVEQYPNGQIPMSVLCPLRAAAGHYLRADAAYAFDRMSQAYVAQFGRAICITDSYRSYAAQVSVFARKPGLAAVPGTSNHGWGTATDLCGGIQSFTSSQHRWMSVNAPLYGWFHPGWAQQNGSKPEPWHWEYGG